MPVDQVAEELAMEVVIARTSSVRDGLELYNRLIDFVGIERAGQLTKEAQEILSMVIPPQKDPWPPHFNRKPRS